MYRSDRGLTLIETMVTVVIIGVLVSIAVPSFIGFRNRAHDREAQVNVRQALISQRAHFAENGTYVGYAFQFGIGATGQSALQEWDPSFRAYGWPDALNLALIYPNFATWDVTPNISSTICITALSEAGTWFILYQEDDGAPLYAEMTGFFPCNPAIKTNPAFQPGGW